jgi:hypothetical protein
VSGVSRLRFGLNGEVDWAAGAKEREAVVRGKLGRPGGLLGWLGWFQVFHFSCFLSLFFLKQHSTLFEFKFKI